MGALRDQLSRVSDFAATTLRADTLNGVLDGARLQFLLADSQRVLDPLVMVAGIPVAGVGDLLATTLEAISGRAELRDYFDVMAIEQQTGHLV